jgi:hypothetical protein
MATQTQNPILSDTRTAIGAAGWAGRFGALTPGENLAVGEASNVVGAYTDFQRGGAIGDILGTANVAQLGARTGVLPAAAGTIAGDIIAPLAVYEFGKNWRSGATGMDALQGAEAGAAVGSVVPGIGTLIGAVGGAIVGGVSSLFGPGREDPENVGWNEYAQAYQQHGAAGVAGASPSTDFQMLSGIFDSRGSAIPFYGKYGRMGENQFMQGMTQTINQAISRGQVSPGSSPAEIYSKVVEPWINAMSPGGWKDTATIQGAPEKQAVGNLLTDMIGQYQAGEQGAWTGITGQAPQVTPFGSMGVGAATPPTVRATSARSKVPTRGSTTMAGPQYQMNDPSSSQMMGASPWMGGVPQVGMVGASSADSPPGVAASPSGLPDGWQGILPYAVGAGAGLFGASQAASSNRSAISPLYGAGTPYLAAGQNLLGQAGAGLQGNLPPLIGQGVATSNAAGKALIQGSTPVGNIAAQDFQQYQSGNLKAGDQAQLDQSVTQAKAQVLQSLGPNVDSTVAATYMAQIDQQAQITKQQMLNSYFATGNQAFDSWLTGTQAGQQTIIQGQQWAVGQVDNLFQTAFGAGLTGMTPLMQAVQSTLQSNGQVANALQNFMANLTKGFALAQASRGAAGAPQALTPGDYTNMNEQIAASPGLNPDMNIDTGINSDINAAIPSGSVEVGAPGDYTDSGGGNG